MKRYFSSFYALISLALCPFWATAQIIYVSPTGNASNTGQIVSLPTTLQVAINNATPGTTIYLRGGRYVMTAKISMPSTKSGTAAATIKLFANPDDERPILDFSALGFSSANRGIEIAASYWSLKGFDIVKAGDNGIFMSGSNNTIEFCTFSENQDTGLQIGGGASNNKIINCDSYYNVDPSQGNADGFAIKLDVGTGNSFKGCRAWQNSDDGWDGYLRPSDDVSTTLDSCWAFRNGYLKDGSVATNGNGNGFKLGGSDAKDLRHNMTVRNCLSFQNTSNGYDQNSNLGNMTLYNCTAFNNGRNFRMDLALAAGKIADIKNCISAGVGLTVPGKTTITSSFSILASVVQATNSWSAGFTATTADFLSIDPTAAFGPRNADGSLPNITFMHLTQTSALRNRGTSLGLTFNGNAPDLGCFETKENVGLKNALADDEGIIKLYPVVSNTILHVEIETNRAATLSICTMDGHIINTKTFLAKGITTQNIDISGLANGVYFIIYQSEAGFMTKKFIKNYVSF